VVPSRQRYQVNFSAGLDPALRYLNRPEELQVPLGDPKYGQIFWTNGYSPEETAAVLAHFEDGSAAVLRKSWGKGAAYLCGVSFHDVVLGNQVNRDFDAERHYVNPSSPAQTFGCCCSAPGMRRPNRQRCVSLRFPAARCRSYFFRTTSIGRTPSPRR